MKIAYLVNQYPKVSHTFIRREILALEQLGAEVSRYSSRGHDADLADPEDLREQARTRVLLPRGSEVTAWLRLAIDVLSVALARPRHFLSALARTFQIGVNGDRPLLVHFAYLAQACRLTRWMETDGCTHLHAHFGTNPAAIALLCRHLGAPSYSFTVHGPEEFDKPDAIALPTKIRHCAFVVAVSSFGRSQLYRWTDPSAWSKVRVVRCGVDARFLEYSSNSSNSVGPSEEPTLVCVGRLCAQKGQLLLIEAMARARSAGVRFKLVLAGDGEMRTQIEARASELGIRSYIRITGWIGSDQVRAEILAARAMVLPSFAEGLPVALMEAMALGRPVITTMIAGIPELVQQGFNGWLLPAGNVDALVDALVDCCSRKPEELRAMGHHGAARVAALHDAKSQASVLLTMFDECRRSSSVPVETPLERKPGRSTVG